MKAAIRDPNPVIFLENEILYGHSSPVPKLDDFVVPIGKAKIARAGKDVTIVAWSMGMTYAMKAAEELAKEGIEAEVIDLRTLRPMDTETIIESVKKTGRAVTIEEGWQQSGVGAEIAARIMEKAFDYLDAPVTRVSGKDVPMPYAANLEKLALPSVAEVVEAVKAVCVPVSATDAHQHPHARAVAHHGEGQPRALAQEGRRQDQVGRRHRRDRDRQGDDGIRGGRRRHSRQDRGAGRHAGRRGECGDRSDGGRGRGREGGGSAPKAEAQRRSAEESGSGQARTGPRSKARSCPQAQAPKAAE